MDINESLYMHKGLEIIWKRQIANQENINFSDEINNVLTKYGISEQIDHTHLVRVQTDNIDTLVLSFFNHDDNDKNKLVKIIENFIWNDLDEGDTFYHFTQESIGRDIAESKILRQYNILKRYSDGEIKDFIDEFNIPNFHEEHYNSIFYTSFTTEIPKCSDKNSIQKFRHFTGVSGARLKFRVLKKDNNLRKIGYCKSKFKILHDLRDVLKSKYNIEFNLNGFTTRLASFYVDEKYSDENEIRLYKNLHFDKQSIIKDQNNMPYIVLQLDEENSILQLEEIVYESQDEIFNDK